MRRVAAASAVLSIKPKATAARNLFSCICSNCATLHRLESGGAARRNIHDNDPLRVNKGLPNKKIQGPIRIESQIVRRVSGRVNLTRAARRFACEAFAQEPINHQFGLDLKLG